MEMRLITDDDGFVPVLRRIVEGSNPDVRCACVVVSEPQNPGSCLGETEAQLAVASNANVAIASKAIVFWQDEANPMTEPLEGTRL